MNLDEHDRPALSESTMTELRVLRVAAAALDLQRLAASSPAAELPSVQALIRAAWAVFRDFGHCEAPAAVPPEARWG
jgi:hypothetical protein